MENDKTTIVHNAPVPVNFREEEIKDDHYVAGDGNLEAAILMPTGHGWQPFMPPFEDQNKNGLETSCCPAYGTLNAVEALGKRQYGVSFQNDLSDRYLSIMSGMTGSGGYPHYIAEVMRTVCGAIPEVFLPFDKTITTLPQFFSPRPMSYALFKVGYHWMQKYDFKHQWVITGTESLQQKQNALKNSLKHSPLGVAGYAWSLHSDGKYYNDGAPIHWFVIFDYVEGEYLLAYDDYFPYIKKLDWNYNVAYAKEYSLTKKLGAENVPNDPQPCIIPYLKYLVKHYLNIQ